MAGRYNNFNSRSTVDLRKMWRDQSVPEESEEAYKYSKTGFVLK